VARAATAARDASSRQRTPNDNTKGMKNTKNLFEMHLRKVFFVSFVSFAFIAAAQEPSQNRREFTIVAKDHVFTPDQLDVSQDDLVKITLRSDDRPTSFAIDAYRIVKRAAGGTSITFEFRADRPGTFTFYCSLTTDPGCKDMKGTLTVRAK
jgi:heme/copper-type cytochrome/quinol oxidase subunit 2